jgi:hypothetical protein
MAIYDHPLSDDAREIRCTLLGSALKLGFA